MQRLAIIGGLAAGLFALVLTPALAQERPSPQGHGGEHAVSRPSGGGSSSPAPSSPSGSSSSSSPSGGSSAGTGPSRGGDYAVPRGGARRGSGSGGGATVRSGSPKSVIVPGGPESPRGGEHRAPDATYSRPRAGRPTTGTAVPRDISNIPDLGWRRDPYWAYGYWRYNRWMPFYYGPWGGYMYYDPFWWDYYYGYYPGSYSYGYGGYARVDDSDYDTGKLRLKVRPRDAQVYVDGYFSGVVDDYDGVLQRLRLRAGAHRIELRAEGYVPTVFDILVVAGETVTYRGELKPRP